MSGFDSNPFADPEAGLGGHSENKKSTEELIDDFNPFAVDQFANQQPAASQPAIMQPSTSTEQPPPYTVSSSIPAPVASSLSATQSVTDDLQRRQEELDRKAAEIDRREKEMNQNIQASTRTNNFPPLPKWFPIKPCFYQDFNVDIPGECQKIVKAHFYLWMSYCILLLVNVGGALGSLITNSASQAGTTFGLSILYFILFTPCAFVCWYRPVYKAFRSDSSFNFFFYFFVFFIQFCANCIQAIGINGSGTCGFINGIGSTQDHLAVGIIMIIIGSLFASCAVIAMILLLRVHRIYRSSDASFSKAQQEFSQGVMQNKTVRQTATSVASEAARSAAEQTFTDVRH